MTEPERPVNGGGYDAVTGIILAAAFLLLLATFVMCVIGVIS